MTAATRYAQALFDLAQESSVEATTAAVTALAAALEDTSVATALANPRLTIAQRTQLAASMAKAVKAPIHLANTLSVLAANNRLSHTGAVLQSYLEKADTASGITHVKVSTAAQLSDAQRAKITTLVKGYTKSADVRLEESLDASLKGGFRAFFNGQVWDASLSGSLARLSTRLKAAIVQR